MPTKAKPTPVAPSSMLDAEIILGGFRFKVRKLSQPDLLALIAALQTLVK